MSNSLFMGKRWHGFLKSAFPRYGRFCDFSEKAAYGMEESNGKAKG
jgi:hypothetical protein